MAYLKRIRKKRKKKRKRRKIPKIKSESYKFEFIRVIGEGATGKVSLVKNRTTNQLLAEKVLPLSSNEQRNRSMMVGLRFISKLNETNHIVGLINHFKRLFKMYLHYEYMDCGSLCDIIKHAKEQNKKIPERIIANISHQVLLGLKYLHEDKRIIHRDIKPSNILLNYEGFAKIDDLGNSSVVRLKYTSQTYLGTMTFMSPERFNGEPHGCNTDIWSLGLTLTELALLEFPFTLEPGNPWAVFEIIAKYRSEKNLFGEPASTYSEEFGDFIYHMLNLDRVERPEASSLLEHPFLEKYNELVDKADNESLSLWLLKFLKMKDLKEEDVDETERVQYVVGKCVKKNVFRILINSGRTDLYVCKVFL